ncbi:MAG: hypothetical protein QOE92_76 [Chloroflexota bacterium]|jgi:hypothetical protein|nr:hypothetical protein [Chloroflexota bacterium]
MPVFVDLGQFPRLVCERCGLVALVDPELPMDLHPSLECPNCLRMLSRPRVPMRRAADADRAVRRPARASRAASGPMPSNAAVGLAIAAIVMLALIAAFVLLAVFQVRGPGFDQGWR